MSQLRGHLELAQLIEDLREMPAEIRKELGPEFVAAAQPVLTDARARASWSSRIPGAMRVRARRSLRRPGASLVVNSRRAPHARLYEDLTGAGSFRAPLFGNRRYWYSHATRPFARPAVQAGRSGFIRAADRAVVQAARRHGFR